MSDFTIEYSVLCDVFFDRSRSLKWVLCETYPTLENNQMCKIISDINKRFLPHFNVKLKLAQRNRRQFNKKYGVWLKNVFTVNFTGVNLEPPGPSNHTGRPRKSFCEVQGSYPQNVIDAAASNAPKVQKAFNTDSALALITQAGLSKYQYEILRKATKNIGHNIFPSYKEIAESKQKCYPDNIIVTETMAKVDLQE